MIYLYIQLHTDSIWTSRTFACPILYPSLSGGFNSAQRSWLPPVGGRDGLCFHFFWFYRNPYFIAGFLKGNCCKFVSKKASEVDELARSFTDVGHQQVPFPGVAQNSWLAPPAGDWDWLLKIMGSCPTLGSRNSPFQDCCGHVLTGAKSILYHLILLKPMNVPPLNGLVTSSKMGAAAESRFEAWVCPMSSNWHFRCE